MRNYYPLSQDDKIHDKEIDIKAYEIGISQIENEIEYKLEEIQRLRNKMGHWSEVLQNLELELIDLKKDS